MVTIPPCTKHGGYVARAVSGQPRNRMLLQPPPGAPTSRMMMGRERTVMEPGLTAGPAPAPQNSPAPAPCSAFWAQQHSHQSADRVVPVERGALWLSSRSLLSSAQGICVFKATTRSGELGTAKLPQEGGGALANISLQVVHHFSLGEPYPLYFLGAYHAGPFRRAISDSPENPAERERLPRFVGSELNTLRSHSG